ncbi:hypothetical protein [Tessaracoccus sp. Z1128]
MDEIASPWSGSVPRGLVIPEFDPGNVDEWAHVVEIWHEAFPQFLGARVKIEVELDNEGIMQFDTAFE